MIELRDFPTKSVTELRQKCEAVKEHEIEKIKQAIEDKFPKRGAEAVAAPQIGILKKAFIWKDREGILRFVCNPTITHQDGPTRFVNEGCLSFPGSRIDSKRFTHVEVLYRDHNFESKLDKFYSTQAVVFQHEIDHLEGMIFTDRMYPKFKSGSNDPCPCGSSVKFKKCCGV